MENSLIVFESAGARDTSVPVPEKNANSLQVLPSSAERYTRHVTVQGMVQCMAWYSAWHGTLVHWCK